ncbi:hypothetical protein EDB83DRAFT_2523175 [Lactarius deliciosus]|nr:hypothetical protein EDB83DRAFT_2523175 [Lactarius deliciosus]
MSPSKHRSPPDYYAPIDVVKNRQQNTSVAAGRVPEEMERALLLTFGVNMSSYLKDLVCSPRPYAPPVVRLTVGNHHLEYGVPSTHSTNATPMALFLGAHVYDLHRLGSLSTTAFATWVVILFVYVFSIVGRLYTGTHGFMDCSVGIILGAISWLLQHLVMPEVEKWVQSSDWSAPLVVTVVCLLLVNQHPSPVDDCLYFEDNRIYLGHLRHHHQLLVLEIIFSRRIFAKPSVQTLLPPLFRWLAWASPVRLPHRRHYTPATEYVYGPPHTLRAVPSMIDLDLSVAEVVDEDAGEKAVTFEEASEGGTREDGEVKHYDADVLTKVVVSVGIGAIATVMVPALFEGLEWGV